MASDNLRTLANQIYTFQQTNLPYSKHSKYVKEAFMLVNNILEGSIVKGAVGYPGDWALDKSEVTRACTDFVKLVRQAEEERGYPIDQTITSSYPTSIHRRQTITASHPNSTQRQTGPPSQPDNKLQIFIQPDDSLELIPVPLSNIFSFTLVPGVFGLAIDRHGNINWEYYRAARAVKAYTDFQ